MSPSPGRHTWRARRNATGDSQPTGFRPGRRVRVLSGVSLGALLILAGCSSNSNSATPSSTVATTGGSTGGKAPITIALVTSLTGPGADQFVPGPDAFNARIAAQNAIGGVNGHLIKGIVVDDQTTQPTLAIQNALSKGAFGIVAESPLFFLGDKIPQQEGVPVTGGSVDGAEWGEQPYTNMFAADTGSVDPTQPASTLPGKFLKEHGGTILGAYAYPIGGTSKVGAVNASKSFVHAGGTSGVLNTTVPISSVDFTGDAIVAKQSHVNAVYPDMGNQSNDALVTAFLQEGVNPKVTLLPTGYQEDVVSTPAWHSLQGTYFASMFRPFSAPDAGTEAMDAAMKKYEHWTNGQFPTFAEYEAWVGADLMIQGLKLAGSDPTRSKVIKDLRAITSYNANGILPVSIDYATVFGHSASPDCRWFLRAETSGFKLLSPTPECGTWMAGS
jgi:branched-chain amino acid transport system substrate-binding protein